MISTHRLLVVSLITVPLFLTSACDNGQVSSSSTNAQVHTSQDKFYPNEIKGPLGIRFVLIPAGSFYMGCDDTDAYCSEDSRPRHKVTISKPFYISKYPITIAQWNSVVPTRSTKSKSSKHPVVEASWPSVEFFFINTINNAEGTLKYRLPTEAEWEYAARAGTTTRYWFGDDDSGLSDVAWYRSNSSQKTHPVGQKKPNPWGLYDMYGNVAEWVKDWAGKYPTESDQVDPRGPANLPMTTINRVIRGGSWDDDEKAVNSYARSEDAEGNEKIGFRLAFTPDESDLVEPESGLLGWFKQLFR